MQVYGSPRYRAPGAQVLDSLAGESAALVELRTRLIQAGQLEQAAADGPIAAEVLERLMGFTEACAQAFYEAFSGKVPAAVQPPALASELNAELSFNVPEGYEFYSLYPEQYLITTQAWLAQRRPAPCLVLGLRSIGTGLSALVTVVLQAHGWPARRATVRPHGHPFDRRVDLPSGLRVSEFSLGLVVDEGPGLSGSSMAAAAEALTEAGCRDIHFFPGHISGPGHQASPRVKKWWDSVPIHSSPLQDVRWGPRDFREVLIQESAELLHFSPEEIQWQELGGGEWRRAAYDAESEWPGCTGGFERAKYLCASVHGAVLWKFDGLGSLGGAGGCVRQTCSPVAVPILARRLGFVAMPWRTGRRARRHDLNPALLDQMARHIQATAVPADPCRLLEGARALRETALHNFDQACGSPFAEAVRPCLEALTDLPNDLAYGDGHLAPHEWVHGPGGALWKTDWWGHDCDHTLVGSQCITWDLAGAIVEWELSGPQRAHLVQACGVSLNPDHLGAFTLAYIAFRAGMLQLLAEQASPSEAVRLRAEQQRLLKFTEQIRS